MTRATMPRLVRPLGVLVVAVLMAGCSNPAPPRATPNEVNPVGPTIRVENVHGSAVTVTPWDGGAPIQVADRDITSLPTSGFPAPPWHVVISDAASHTKLYDGTLGYDAPQLLVVAAAATTVEDGFEIGPDPTPGTATR